MKAAQFLIVLGALILPAQAKQHLRGTSITAATNQTNARTLRVLSEAKDPWETYSKEAEQASAGVAVFSSSLQTINDPSWESAAASMESISVLVAVTVPPPAGIVASGLMGLASGLFSIFGGGSPGPSNQDILDEMNKGFDKVMSVMSEGFNTVIQGVDQLESQISLVQLQLDELISLSGQIYSSTVLQGGRIKTFTQKVAELSRRFDAFRQDSRLIDTYTNYLCQVADDYADMQGGLGALGSGNLDAMLEVVQQMYANADGSPRQDYRQITDSVTLYRWFYQARASLLSVLLQASMLSNKSLTAESLGHTTVFQEDVKGYDDILKKYRLGQVVSFEESRYSACASTANSIMQKHGWSLDNFMQPYVFVTDGDCSHPLGQDFSQYFGAEAILGVFDDVGESDCEAGLFWNGRDSLQNLNGNNLAFDQSMLDLTFQWLGACTSDVHPSVETHAAFLLNYGCGCRVSAPSRQERRTDPSSGTAITLVKSVQLYEENDQYKSAGTAGGEVESHWAGLALYASGVINSYPMCLNACYASPYASPSTTSTTTASPEIATMTTTTTVTKPCSEACYTMNPCTGEGSASLEFKCLSKFAIMPGKSWLDDSTWGLKCSITSCTGCRECESTTTTTATTALVAPIQIISGESCSGDDCSSVAACPLGTWVIECASDPPNFGDGIQVSNTQCTARGSGGAIRAVAVCSSSQTTSVSKSSPYTRGIARTFCDSGRVLSCYCHSLEGECIATAFTASDAESSSCQAYGGYASPYYSTTRIEVYALCGGEPLWPSCQEPATVMDGAGWELDIAPTALLLDDYTVCGASSKQSQASDRFGPVEDPATCAACCSSLSNCGFWTWAKDTEDGQQKCFFRQSSTENIRTTYTHIIEAYQGGKNWREYITGTQSCAPHYTLHLTRPSVLSLVGSEPLHIREIKAFADYEGIRQETLSLSDASLSAIGQPSLFNLTDGSLDTDVDLGGLSYLDNEVHDIEFVTGLPIKRIEIFIGDHSDYFNGNSYLTRFSQTGMGWAGLDVSRGSQQVFHYDVHEIESKVVIEVHEPW